MRGLLQGDGLKTHFPCLPSQYHFFLPHPHFSHPPEETFLLAIYLRIQYN